MSEKWVRRTLACAVDYAAGAVVDYGPDGPVDYDASHLWITRARLAVDYAPAVLWISQHSVLGRIYPGFATVDYAANAAVD